MKRITIVALAGALGAAVVIAYNAASKKSSGLTFKVEIPNWPPNVPAAQHSYTKPDGTLCQWSVVRQYKPLNYATVYIQCKLDGKVTYAETHNAPMMRLP